MSSIEEVQAQIAAANEEGKESLGALSQALASLESMQAVLLRATEGSGQADVGEANGLVAQSIEDLELVRQMVAAALSSVEGVAGRL